MARRATATGGQEAQNSRSGPPGATKRSKYGSQATEAEGIRFSSKREATRWQRLQIAEKAGIVCNLRRQIAYELRAEGGNLVGKYIADHVYEELIDGVWGLIVEDVKGFPTPLYAWKKKHMLAEHGIEIREV